MLFVVHCLDKPNVLPLRMENYEAHKAHLAGGEMAIVVSGPLVAGADENAMIGSMFIFEAESQDAVERFVGADPFNRLGVWGEVSIARFLMRVDNRGAGAKV